MSKILCYLGFHKNFIHPIGQWNSLKCQKCGNIEILGHYHIGDADTPCGDRDCDV